MKETHKVKFKVDKPNDYRDWIGSKDHIIKIEKYGGKLLSLYEHETGVWDMKIIIDRSHPEHEKIITIAEKAGYKIDLLAIPTVTHEEANLEMLQELDRIKSRIKQVV
tara:strand:+ start:339 stop:662 length:324 start_codon:yes stop_codon:yes gene_type:complete